MSEEEQEVIAEEVPLVIGSPEDISIGSDASEEVPAEEIQAAPAENIKIGDQSFEKQADAWDYANKLAEERLAQDAYRQGMDDALRTQPQVTQPSAEPQEDDFDEKFYSDPKGFLKQYGEDIRQSVKSEITQEQTVQQREKELWNKFWSDNPDLQVKERLVKSILSDEWDVLGKMKSSDEALKILAAKTRAELKKWSEAEKPSTELARVAAPVSAGRGGQVTQPVVAEKSVDFLSQINDHQKGRLI